MTDISSDLDYQSQSVTSSGNFTVTTDWTLIKTYTIIPDNNFEPYLKQLKLTSSDSVYFGVTKIIDDGDELILYTSPSLETSKTIDIYTLYENVTTSLKINVYVQSSGGSGVLF